MFDNLFAMIGPVCSAVALLGTLAVAAALALDLPGRCALVGRR